MIVKYFFKPNYSTILSYFFLLKWKSVIYTNILTKLIPPNMSIA